MEFSSYRGSIIKGSERDVSDLTSLKNSHEGKNQYYNLYKQQSDLNVSSTSLIHKSIIPEIDFTNKYVRRNNNNYESRNESLHEGSQIESPFRNKYSQMEHISQFENE